MPSLVEIASGISELWWNIQTNITFFPVFGKWLIPLTKNLFCSSRLKSWVLDKLSFNSFVYFFFFWFNKFDSVQSPFQRSPPRRYGTSCTLQFSSNFTPVVSRDWIGIWNSFYKSHFIRAHCTCSLKKNSRKIIVLRSSSGYQRHFCVQLLLCTLV